MTKYDDKIKDAEVLRSLDSVIDSWEKDDLDVEDMSDHLEAVNEVANGDMNFSEFIRKTKLRKIFDA